MKKTIIFSLILFVATTTLALAQAKAKEDNTKDASIEKKETSNGKTVADDRTDKKIVVKDTLAAPKTKTNGTEKKTTTTSDTKSKSKTSTTEKKSTEKKVEEKEDKKTDIKSTEKKVE
jgi:hypothetical protein